MLSSLTVLGGCAANLEDCPERNAIVSSKEGKSILPDGCQTVSVSLGGVSQIVCSDGRQGFAVGGIQGKDALQR